MRTFLATTTALLALVAGCGQTASGDDTEAGASDPTTPQGTQDPSDAVPLPRPVGPGDESKRLICPETYQGAKPGWVPDRAPARLAQAGLVPDAAPDAAVLCAYRGQNTKSPRGLSLTTQFEPKPQALTRGLAELRALEAASGSPEMCTEIAGPATEYLLALRYGQGVVWVSTEVEPNHCTDATNGTFTASTDGAPAMGVLRG